MLKMFAEQMRDSFRTSDLVARLGGDEFVALLTNVDADMIKVLIARFDTALQERCAALALPCFIGFSYGLVPYEPLKHASVEDMLHEADSAMYAHKKSGGR